MKKFVSFLLAVLLLVGLLTTASADWTNFRGSADNMAVTTAPVPLGAEEAAEKWVTESSLSSGTGWNISNPAPMLLVNGNILTTCGAELLELDADTGEILRRAQMAEGVGTLGNSAPVYGDGTVFMPLQDGRVQAFDVATFTSLWVSEVLGSQCTTGLAYGDGFVYGCTGNGTPAGVFCLDADNADGTAVWNVYCTGDETGSYWSTPLVTDTAVVYGTDSGFLCSRNPADGTLLSRLQLPEGKQRSGIALYEGRVYGGTSAGYLFSAALGADGTLSDLKAEKDESVFSITSTPVIYNGVVYYGGNKTVVAADATTLKTLRTSGDTGFENPSFGGAVQCSLLLHPEEGAVYLYATQNCPPGSLYVVKDTGAEMTASVLYTPEEGMQDYCLVSPICDEEGTIYYRNDSGYIFAVEKSAGDDEGGNQPSQPPVNPPQETNITAYVAVKNHLGAYLYPKTAITVTSGTTAYELLLKTGLSVDAVDTAYGMYVRSIAGLAEKSAGETSGWLYDVNGESPMVGASALVLQEGDYIVWSFYAGETTPVPVAPAAPAEPKKEQTEQKPVYADMEGHWGKAVMETMVEKGLMKGISDKEFAPDAPLTRGMLVTILHRMAGEPAAMGGFTDVESGSWYAAASAWAAQEKIAQGDGDGSFRPMGNITRQELAVMLWRYAGSAESGALVGFSDSAKVAPWAEKALGWAVEQGILSGRTDGTLAPEDLATRAEAAAMLVRFMEAQK